MTPSDPGSVTEMPWAFTNRADPEVRELADRHYNRQKIGAAQYVPPGRCLVLKTVPIDAFWITSWPFAEYVQHAWAGAWMCSAFRNEGSRLASDLILAAVSATRAYFGAAPEFGLVTFVDASKIKPKRDPGYCYLMAGFKKVGKTKGGLDALQMLPDEMPSALPALMALEAVA